MVSKEEIRRRIRQERAKVDEQRWVRDTKKIAAAVIGHPWFADERNLYVYADHKKEAGTGRIMAAAFQRGMNVWVPRVTGDAMLFCRVRSMDELRPGRYGILEPTGTEISNGEEGLMVMPGVAFDETCHRVGYGGGFYDRYLAEHRELRRMAIGFEFQVLEEVPYEEHDICPEILVTERRIIETERGPGQEWIRNRGGEHMQIGLPKDPVMMLSVVNTKMRDDYHTLDDLCKDMGIEKADIINKLRTIGYEYDEGRRQFV